MTKFSYCYSFLEIFTPIGTTIAKYGC